MTDIQKQNIYRLLLTFTEVNMELALQLATGSGDALVLLEVEEFIRGFREWQEAAVITQQNVMQEMEKALNQFHLNGLANGFNPTFTPSRHKLHFGFDLLDGTI